MPKPIPSLASTIILLAAAVSPPAALADPPPHADWELTWEAWDMAAANPW